MTLCTAYASTVDVSPGYVMYCCQCGM